MENTAHEHLTYMTRGLAEAEHADYIETFRTPVARPGTQFLFFLKPELLDPGTGNAVGERLSFIIDKLDAFGLAVERIITATGRYLGKYGIISEHYGVIDRIARNPHAYLPDTGQAVFREEFDIAFDRAHVVGGIEYLRLHHGMSPDELSRAWLDRGYTKLGGGCYCQYLADEDLYLFNGFYPKLLKHYTRRSARIIIMVVSGDIEWRKARADFAGATNPKEASPGSIRRSLLEKADEFGLSEVSANLNGVHLSAGPVEALVELLRFTTDRSKAGETGSLEDRYREFAFGKELSVVFEDDEIRRILENPDVPVDDTRVSIFDLTENLDPSDAVETLESVRDQLMVRT